jgi:hypothetical protein
MNETLLGEFTERVIAAEEAFDAWGKAKAEARAPLPADRAEQIQRAQSQRVEEARLRFEICHHRLLGFFEGVIASTGPG